MDKQARTPYQHQELREAVDYCIKNGYTLIIDDEWMSKESMQKEYPKIRIATPQDVNNLHVMRCLCVTLKVASKCQVWNIKNFTAYMNVSYVTFEAKYVIVRNTIQENPSMPRQNK